MHQPPVEKIFGKFKQDKVKNYRVDLGIPSGMNHIERQIIDFVAKLFPEEFQHLVRYQIAREIFQRGSTPFHHA